MVFDKSLNIYIKLRRNYKFSENGHVGWKCMTFCQVYWLCVSLFTTCFFIFCNLNPKSIPILWNKKCPQPTTTHKHT